MKSMTKQIQNEELFIGIDLHKRRYQLDIKGERGFQGREVRGKCKVQLNTDGRH
jgi:hypothetical protein